MKAKELAPINDSQLVVQQIQGEYEAKEPSMHAYLDWVCLEISKFAKFHVYYIPREENLEASALSKVTTTRDLTGWQAIYIETLNSPSTDSKEALLLDKEPS